jgi:hypothetical protein
MYAHQGSLEALAILLQHQASMDATFLQIEQVNLQLMVVFDHCSK